MLESIRIGLAAFAIAALSAASTSAFSPPEGPVLLTVEGLADVQGPVAFDRALLEALPAVELTTATIWTDGEQVFTGVELAVLLAHLGVEGGTLRAIAINDYSVDIPVADAVPGGPIIAYLQNGAPMSVRDRGPLWIIYPYDASAAYRTEAIYARSIWQLSRIELE